MARVFDFCAPRLLGLARCLSRDEAAAEDLVQETFLTAIEAAKDYDEGRAVLPWLVGILTNQVRVHRKVDRRKIDPERLGGSVVPAGSDFARE